MGGDKIVELVLRCHGMNEEQPLPSKISPSTGDCIRSFKSIQRVYIQYPEPASSTTIENLQNDTI